MDPETDLNKPLLVHIGCTQDELKAAVKATGSVNVEKLEAYLNSKGQKRK